MTETSEYDRRNMRAHIKRVSDNGLLKLLNDADRLAALEHQIRELASSLEHAESSVRFQDVRTIAKRIRARLREGDG